MEHYKKIRIEGFRLDKLIDKCLKNRIVLKNICFMNDMELILFISSQDYKRLKKLAKNTYKITVLQNKGGRPLARGIWKRKATIIGVLLFAALILYQSLFVVEIQVDGYEKVPEKDLRQCLKDSGLYEGCRRNLDVSKVKLKLYEQFDEISWVGIDFEGQLAKVKIVEGANKIEPKIKKEKPCNIVADRPGYIAKIIPIEGVRAKKDGAYVKKGDVLISGEVPLNSTAYGTEGENDTKTYVHAEGVVQVKIPQRLVYYGQRYTRVKTPTGRKLWGLCINGFNTAKAVNRYEASKQTGKNIMNWIKPFPLKIDLIKLEEVELTEKETDKKALMKAANAEIRHFAKTKLPKGGQILDQDIDIVPGKDTVKIGITLETLQKIGIEREIKPPKPKKNSKKAA